MTAHFSADFSLELPRRYRSNEVFAFHARDPEGLSERTDMENIHKGVLVDGVPSVLEISVRTGRAVCRVATDGSPSSGDAFRRIARNLLGLCIDPEPFESLAKGDRLFGPLIPKQIGLRIPQAATAFEALTWAIIGQQINLSFATTLRRTLIRLAGRRHSSGLWCYPEASGVARMNPAELSLQKFSRAKAETLIRVARLVDGGELPLSQWEGHAPEEIAEALLPVKGIGPWTINYTLLRGFGCGDCSLHGDAGIRAALQRLTVGSAKLSASEIEVLLERYKPYRSMAAAHLWASL